jgi:hypothetical protein
MKLILTFAALLLSIGSALAQGEANSLKGVPIKERIVTGGGMGLGFSSVQDYVSVSPVLGYQVTKKLMTGVGFTYRYTNYKIIKPSLKLNDYGLNPFVRFTFYKNIFVQTEYEYLNYEFPISTRETTRQDFTSFLAGGGFIQPLSDKVGFYMMVLYNFSYKTPGLNEYSAYQSPWVIRAGINIGALGFGF